MEKTLDFAVIGAQKAATTWLTSNLGKHPNVLIPVHELPCFEGDSANVDPLSYLRPNPPGIRVKGVKNNNLFISSESPRILFRHHPNLKFIVILRDPVDRLLSAYYWQMWVGEIPVLPPNEGIPRFLEQRDNQLLRHGFYAEHLLRFFRVFGPDRIHIILFMDLREDAAECLQNAYDFLEVESHFRPEDMETRPKASVYNLHRVHWNSIRNPFILEKGRSHQRRTLWKSDLSLVDRIVNGLVVGMDRLVLAPLLSNEKPALSQGLIGRIRSVYAEDSEQLQEMIGRDLSGWKTIGSE